MLKSKLYVAIEGNIGAGKSTLVRRLQEKLQGSVSYHVVEEPVHFFTSAILGGKEYNPLAEYYKEPFLNAFPFQLWVNNCYSKQLCNLSAQTSDDDVIIVERSIHSTNIFLDTNREQGYFSEFSYQYLLNELNKNIVAYFGEKNQFGPDKVFYLDTPFSICLGRIQQRNREGEDVSKLRGHLLALDAKYEDYMTNFVRKKGRSALKRYYSPSLDELVEELLLFINSK